MPDIDAIMFIRDLYDGTLGRVIEQAFMMNRALGMTVVAALVAAISAGLKAILPGRSNGDGGSVEE
jgi:hypothetical protein